MPTKINAFSAVDGEPIHLLDSWFGTQLSGVHISPTETAECGLGARAHSFTSVGAVSSPTDHLNNTTRPLMMSASIGSAMSALSESTNVTVQTQPLSAQHTTSTSSSPFNALGNTTSLTANALFASVAHNCNDSGAPDSAQHQRTSAVPSGVLSSISHSQPTLGVVPRPHPQQFVVDGLTFEHSEEALAWTLTKRKLLAIIGKADCFVSARLCPYDVLLGVSVVENPEKEKKATQAGAGSNQNSTNHASGNVSQASLPSSAGVPTTAVASHTATETILPVGRGNFAGAMLAAPIIGPTPTAIFGGSPTCLASSAPTTLVNSPEGTPQHAAGSCSAAAVATASAAPSQSAAQNPHSAIRHRSTPIAPSHSSYSSNRTNVVVVADPVVEPEYRPWPLTKGTLGEILAQCAEENGVALTAADDAPKASDAVGFAAAMVAKLCRKAVLHNPNYSEAHFVVNLLVFSRPIGNEYAPSHGLYRVPHAPSAVTKERCSSAVVLSVIGKVMEETRLLASGGVVGEDGKVRLVGDAVGATGYSDRPPLPRAAIGVAEKVKQHGLQLLQELHILQLALQASGVNRFRNGVFSGGPNGGSGDASGEVDANSPQREAEEAAILENLLREHFQNSIDVVAQFTGADDRDALFALMDSAADLEAAAARVVEGVGLVGANAVPIGRLRAYAKDYLDQHTVNEALAAKLGTCLGAINGVGSTASGAPEAAARYPLVACADRLVSMGYTQEEAGRASRGAGGNFDLAAGFLAGDHSVQRHVKQKCEEVLWFNNVVEALRRGSCKSSLQEVSEVVDMVSKDPQSILRAWHTPRLQQAVKALSDAFVQAIMQHKQAAMMRLQQQQQQQAAARMGFSSSSSASAGVAGGGHSVQHIGNKCPTVAAAQTAISLSAALNTAAAVTEAHNSNNNNNSNPQVRGATKGDSLSHAATPTRVHIVGGEHAQTHMGASGQYNPQHHNSGAVPSPQTQNKARRGSLGNSNNQPLPASATNFNPNLPVVGQVQQYHHNASHLQQGGSTHSCASTTMASAPFPAHMTSTTSQPPSYHAVPPAYGHPHSAPSLGPGVSPSPQQHSTNNPPPQYHKQQQPQQHQQHQHHGHLHSTTRPPPKYGNAVVQSVATAVHAPATTTYPSCYASLVSSANNLNDNNNNTTGSNGNNESVVTYSAVNAYSSLPQTYLHHQHLPQHRHQQHLQHLQATSLSQQQQQQPQPHQAAPPGTHHTLSGCHSQQPQQQHQTPQASQQLLPYPFPLFQPNLQQHQQQQHLQTHPNPPASYNLSAHMPTIPMGGASYSGGFQAVAVPASASQQQQPHSMYYVQNPPPHGQFITGGGGGGLAYPAGGVATIAIQQPHQPTSGLATAPPAYYHDQQQQQQQQQQTILSGQHHATGANFLPQAQRTHKY